MDYLSRFNTEIVYMKGVENKVANCLSRYYKMEGGEEVQNKCVNWANADVRLDPEGDDLPHDQLRELRLALMRASQDNVRHSNRLHGKREDRCIEAAELCEHTELSRERTAPAHMSEVLTLLESAGQSLPPVLTSNSKTASWEL